MVLNYWSDLSAYRTDTFDPSTWRALTRTTKSGIYLFGATIDSYLNLKPLSATAASRRRLSSPGTSPRGSGCVGVGAVVVIGAAFILMARRQGPGRGRGVATRSPIVDRRETTEAEQGGSAAVPGPQGAVRAAHAAVRAGLQLLPVPDHAQRPGRAARSQPAADRAGPASSSGRARAVRSARGQRQVLARAQLRHARPRTCARRITATSGARFSSADTVIDEISATTVAHGAVGRARHDPVHDLRRADRHQGRRGNEGARSTPARCTGRWSSTRCRRAGSGCSCSSSSPGRSAGSRPAATVVGD